MNTVLSGEEIKIQYYDELAKNFYYIIYGSGNQLISIKKKKYKFVPYGSIR